MKTKLIIMFILGIMGLGFSQKANAYDCNSNCKEEAKFKYPCPTWNNPGRKCTGINPAKLAACEADKAISCRLWNSAVSFFAPKVKPHLVSRFNKERYESSGDKQEYIRDCIAAATAVLATIGAEIGGPWGALATGAAGIFVSKRICIQSTKW